VILVEIIFKTFTRIGRGDAPTRNRNACKAFVAEISRTCLTHACEWRLKISSELFKGNRVGCAERPTMFFRQDLRNPTSCRKD